MRLTLYRGEQIFELIDAVESPPDPDTRRMNDPTHALAFLRELSLEPLNMMSLRDFLARDEPAKPVCYLSDAEVLEQVAARMVVRRIGLVGARIGPDL
jgi:hypothetical protein